MLESFHQLLHAVEFEDPEKEFCGPKDEASLSLNAKPSQLLRVSPHQVTWDTAVGHEHTHHRVLTSQIEMLAALKSFIFLSEVAEEAGIDRLIAPGDRPGSIPKRDGSPAVRCAALPSFCRRIGNCRFAHGRAVCLRL